MRRIFIYSSQQNMKNKNLSLKWVLVAVAVGFVSMWFCSAITNFHFNIEAVKAIQESLQDDIMQIHFADNWNDFGGFFYFSNGLGNESEWESSENIYYACVATWTDGSEIKKCVLTGSECKEELFTNDGIYIDWNPTFDGNQPYFDTGCSESLTNDPEIDKYQYEVSMNGSEYTCSRQVKWYYYNAERWERLWPLDGDTWSDKVTTTWWFYTMCKKKWYIGALKECLNEAKDSAKNYYDCKDQARKLYATDGDGYYGSIKHVFSGQELNLIAWVKYDPTTKFTSIDAWAGFSPTFIRFGNKYPLWFIYDNNGGVWFVWCRITVNGSMKTLIDEYNSIDEPNPLNYLFEDKGNGTVGYTWNRANVGITCTGLSWDSLIWVVIEWIVWMWEVWNTANFDVIWNQKDEKMQYFSSANINNNTIINYARKKAELLCRWKWKMPDDSIDPNNNKDGIICTSGRNITEAQSDSIKNAWITLIVKNWNVKINPFKSAEINNNNNNKYYDIFIDSWNLIINETESTDKFVIKDNGFVSNTSPSNFNRNVLVGYLHNTGASTSKIEGCIDYFQVAKAENGKCSWFRGNIAEKKAECVQCEEGEECVGSAQCGDVQCEEDEKCEEKTETIPTFDNERCMEYLTKEEWGPCSLDWWLDIVMDPNGDGMVNQDDIDFFDSCPDCSVWNDVAIASIIKWNFIINGNVLGPDRPSDISFDKKLKNKYFIYWKLSSRDSFQSLQDTFAWRCNNWYTTDDSYCLPTNKERWYNNPYEDAFLVVIDQNYENSPFFSAS